MLYHGLLLAVGWYLFRAMSLALGFVTVACAGIALLGFPWLAAVLFGSALVLQWLVWRAIWRRG